MKRLCWVETLILVMAMLCLCACRSTSGNDHDQIVRTSIDLAETYRSQGRPEMAVQVYDRALTQVDDYRLYYNKALALADQGLYTDAAKLCASSFERYPTIIAFKKAQALFLNTAGDRLGYYGVCLEILELNPYDFDTRMKLIEDYSDDGMERQAYEQALILWNQGYMLDSVLKVLEKYNPEYWGNISL